MRNKICWKLARRDQEESCKICGGSGMQRRTSGLLWVSNGAFFSRTFSQNWVHHFTHWQVKENTYHWWTSQGVHLWRFCLLDGLCSWTWYLILPCWPIWDGWRFNTCSILFWATYSSRRLFKMLEIKVIRRSRREVWFSTHKLCLIVNHEQSLSLVKW
jgi:hypothetical protein